ncbi:hypothetical protein HPE56_03410 [Maribacter sp. ANRC-HE7]|uniref:Uncharacterized protein n=1 Tax=Maribacter aquimaris TaxID=2737171 RepID=A0ABR7UWF0_9FLAO|nr:hypothetical protein [Maribacter aquimaris]MBD0776832.1 hypothetical protein [Maribacter aquimaris]
MTHDIEHRDELIALNDRHKRFSLDVYDHMTAGEEKKMLEAHTKMKEAEKELKNFKKNYFNL